MSEIKICTKCHKRKELMTDFYMCSGKYKSECKACTIKRNVVYQKKFKTWRLRQGDPDLKAYMKDYYNKNREKFVKYRANFKAKHPTYYQDYFRKRKSKIKKDERLRKRSSNTLNKQQVLHKDNSNITNSINNYTVITRKTIL